MTTRTDIRPATPALWETLVSLYTRLVSHRISGVMAHYEREASRAELHRLDDRTLKDIGIYRHQINDVTELARERALLQHCRQP